MDENGYATWVLNENPGCENREYVRFPKEECPDGSDSCEGQLSNFGIILIILDLS
jgi:hypothetical protein